MGFDEFLKEVAPRLGLQARPFQRRGIRRKIDRRMLEAGFSHFEEYLLKVQEDSEEQNHLSKILTVTISRFFRDREVFSLLESFILPAIVKNKKGDDKLKIWSIGCASGEEPYSLLLLWKEKFEKVYPQLHPMIIATDIDEHMLRRAKEGRYKKSTLKEIPEEFLKKYFEIDGGNYVLDRVIRDGIEFRKHDILREDPFCDMDLVCCRNLVFTYFSKESQTAVLKKIAMSINEEGYFIIGKNESLPITYPTLFVPLFPNEKVFRKIKP